MDASIIQTIIQVAGAATTGFLVARYSANRQVEKREIYYIKNSIRLLRRHSDTPKSINITIDKSVISGDESDAGELYEVEDAFAHSVSLKNKGNTTITNFVVEVEFDSDAHLLSFDSTPNESAAFPITIERSESNRSSLVATVPYLNSSRELRVSAVVAGGNASNAPKVTVGGEGIHSGKWTGSILSTTVAVLSVLLLGLFTVTVFEGSMMADTMGSMIPHSVVSALGGSISKVEVEVVEFPLLFKLSGIVLGLCVSVFFIRRMIRTNTF